MRWAKAREASKMAARSGAPVQKWSLPSTVTNSTLPPTARTASDKLDALGVRAPRCRPCHGGSGWAAPRRGRTRSGSRPACEPGRSAGARRPSTIPTSRRRQGACHCPHDAESSVRAGSSARTSRRLHRRRSTRRRTHRRRPPVRLGRRSSRREQRDVRPQILPTRSLARDRCRVATHCRAANESPPSRRAVVPEIVLRR